MSFTSSRWLSISLFLSRHIYVVFFLVSQPLFKMLILRCSICTITSGCLAFHAWTDQSSLEFWYWCMIKKYTLLFLSFILIPITPFPAALCTLYFVLYYTPPKSYQRIFLGILSFISCCSNFHRHCKGSPDQPVSERKWREQQGSGGVIKAEMDSSHLFCWPLSYTFPADILPLHHVIIYLVFIIDFCLGYFP